MPTELGGTDGWPRPRRPGSCRRMSDAASVNHPSRSAVLALSCSVTGVESHLQEMHAYAMGKPDLDELVARRKASEDHLDRTSFVPFNRNAVVQLSVNDDVVAHYRL